MNAQRSANFDQTHLAVVVVQASKGGQPKCHTPCSVVGVLLLLLCGLHTNGLLSFGRGFLGALCRVKRRVAKERILGYISTVSWREVILWWENLVWFFLILSPPSVLFTTAEKEFLVKGYISWFCLSCQGLCDAACPQKSFLLER